MNVLYILCDIIIGADIHGSAYIFEYSYNLATNIFKLNETAKLTPTTNTTGWRFGTSVAISDNTTVIGAPSDGNFGGAYIFEKIENEWQQVSKLAPSDSSDSTITTSGFGASVAIGYGIFNSNLNSNKFIIVGSNNGGAYIFEKSISTSSPATSKWIQGSKITGWPLPLDTNPSAGHFGNAISISGNSIVFGAYSWSCIFMMNTYDYGIDNKNDIFAESTLLNLSNLAAVIAIPDLLTPGIRERI